jgi:CRP/FNR family cyclic AMP-dependent transcriptional regulator
LRMRSTKNHRLDALGGVWLFDRCTRQELEALERAATPLSVEAGRVLAKQGEIGREFIVLLDGRAEVRRDDTELAVLGPGSFFGEMSLLDGKPRTATVTALEPSEVLVLTAADFNSVTATMPSVDRKILTVVVERLRELEAKYVPAEERNHP